MSIVFLLVVFAISPVRNRGRTLADNDATIDVLRRRCEEKGLSTTGRKATLISRLQQHASKNTNPGTSTRSTVEQNEPGLLNDAQLSQIQSIVSRSIEQAMSEIATNPARAAVNAIQNSPQQFTPSTSVHHSAISSHNITDAPTSSFADLGQAELSVPVVDLASSETTPRYGHAALDVPAAYVKQIQSGEFFDLSKLLPSDFPAADDGEPVVLTLKNSIIRVKKSNHPTQKITNIEQWTTAFTTYMGVLTSKFPGRSQELLQYMSLIRHAAQTHKGLGWCIYDHKFRRKAALNAALKWSEIDQQLWLCIFTVSPEILRREYPLFSNGPRPTTSSGAVRGGICHEYNRKDECKYTQCSCRHVCNRCSGSHPGYQCSQRPPEHDHTTNSRQPARSNKS